MRVMCVCVYAENAVNSHPGHQTYVYVHHALSFPLLLVFAFFFLALTLGREVGSFRTGEVCHVDIHTRVYVYVLPCLALPHLSLSCYFPLPVSDSSPLNVWTRFVTRMAWRIEGWRIEGVWGLEGGFVCVRLEDAWRLKECGFVMVMGFYRAGKSVNELGWELL